MRVHVLHDQKHDFRVVAIDLIPECRDEERILEAFSGVEAGIWENSPNLQLCLTNKKINPSTTQKSVRNTAVKSAESSGKEIDRPMDRLFSNGAGNEADRLVLTTKDGRDLGGWCKDAARNEIDTTVRRILRQGE